MLHEVLDGQHARRNHRRVEPHRAGKQAGDFVDAAAGFFAQLGQRHQRLNILRIGLEHRVETLPRLIGLFVHEVQAGQLGHGGKIRRVDGQGSFETLARTREVLASELHAAAQVGCQRLAGLLLLQRLDRFQGGVELALAEVGAEQRHVGDSAAVGRGDLLQLRVTLVGVALGKLGYRHGRADLHVRWVELGCSREVSFRSADVTGLQVCLCRQAQALGIGGGRFEYRRQGFEHSAHVA